MRNLIVPIIKPIRVLLGMSLLMLVGCASCGNKNDRLPSPRHPLKNFKNKNFKKFSPAPDDGGQEVTRGKHRIKVYKLAAMVRPRN